MRRSSRALIAATLSVACLTWSAGMARAVPSIPRSPWPLGTMSLVGGGVADCPSGFECTRFRITGCPNVSQDARGELAVGAPSGQASGLVTFFSGGTGQAWWGDSALASTFLERLRRTDHLEVVQIRWNNPWLSAAHGEDAGSAHLACRPATATTWIHDDLYTWVAHQPGACGFCITGSSGGASQVSYALSHFGLDGILDAVVPTSGPPHAALVKGCQPGFQGYRYKPKDLPLIDVSFGFLGRSGPCARESPSWIPRWTEEGVDTGGNDYSHPSTRVEFVIGGRDGSVAPTHAADYRDVLESQGGNSVTWTVVPSMPHDIQLSHEGLAALGVALLGSL